MNSFQKHFKNIVQKDLLLTECSKNVMSISCLEKIKVRLGGKFQDETYNLRCLAALEIITNQKSSYHVTNNHEGSSGGVVTLRGIRMFAFWLKLVHEIFPQVQELESINIKDSTHKHTFVLNDAFVFQEIRPLYPYFENITKIHLTFYFKNSNKQNISNIAEGLLFYISRNS